VEYLDEHDSLGSQRVLMEEYLKFMTIRRDTPSRIPLQPT